MAIKKVITTEVLGGVCINQDGTDWMKIIRPRRFVKQEMWKSYKRFC
jgi:hypothetical protein